MVEPLKITNEMTTMKQKRKDEIMESINNDIRKAISYGWTDTNFNCCEDGLYDEIKREYINAGYKIYPNFFARSGGRNEIIAW